MLINLLLINNSEVHYPIYTQGQLFAVYISSIFAYFYRRFLIEVVSQGLSLFVLFTVYEFTQKNLCVLLTLTVFCLVNHY